jgi:hypothetical protein
MIKTVKQFSLTLDKKIINKLTLIAYGRFGSIKGFSKMLAISNNTFSFYDMKLSEKLNRWLNSWLKSQSKSELLPTLRNA